MINRGTSFATDSKKYAAEKVLIENKHYIDNFQTELDENILIVLWNIFRQSGNSRDGKILRETFKKEFVKYFPEINSEILELIFQRFRHEKSDGVSYREEIDLHDLVVSLIIISRVAKEKKLELLFKLSDFDEDECLVPEEIYKIIYSMEMTFVKENLRINLTQPFLMNEIATKKASHKFFRVMEAIKAVQRRNKKIEKEDGNESNAEDDRLITFVDFMDAFRMDSYGFFETFFPENFSLITILLNGMGSPDFDKSQYHADSFISFHSDIYKVFRPDTEYNPNTVSGKSDFRQTSLRPGIGQNAGNTIKSNNKVYESNQSSKGKNNGKQRGGLPSISTKRTTDNKIPMTESQTTKKGQQTQQQARGAKLAEIAKRALEPTVPKESLMSIKTGKNEDQEGPGMDRNNAESNNTIKIQEERLKNMYVQIKDLDMKRVKLVFQSRDKLFNS